MTTFYMVPALTVLSIVVGAFLCMASTCVFTLWMLRKHLHWRIDEIEHSNGMGSYVHVEDRRWWVKDLEYALWPSVALALIGLTLIGMGLFQLAVRV